MPNDYTEKSETDLDSLHMKYKGLAFQLNGGPKPGILISSAISESKKKLMVFQRRKEAGDRMLLKI